MVPDDLTGEVENFPKEVTIEAEKNEGMLAPNGHSSGERCPNEANCLDSSTKDDSEAPRLAYVTRHITDRTD